jgi:uncharacterized protein
VRLKPWMKRLALLLVAIWAGFVLGWVPYYLGQIATTHRFRYNDKENAGLTPRSLELPYEDVSFQASDGVPLKGWWVPAADPRGTVILVHGLNRSRIEMVKKTPFLHRLGWNCLLFDLRHHGESGGSVTTFGYYEKQDVNAAVALARGRCPGPVILWGVSLGAATATLAAADDPSIAGLVCDSSYRSLSDTVHHHLILFRSFRWWLRIVPSWPVADEVLFWIGRDGGFDPEAVDIRSAAAKIAGRPCLFVCNTGDQRMPKEIAYELQAVAGPKAKLLVVPGGDGHARAYSEAKAPYESAVENILTSVLGLPAAAGLQ